MLPYDKLQRGFANKQTTRNLRFSWCFAVKKGAKTFPRKLNWKTLANCVDKYKFRLKQWSRSYQIFRSIWILEILKMKLQTNELKRCQKRTLTKVLKTRKVSIQAGQLNLHCVPGKHDLNRESLQRPRRNPLKSTRNKNFPGC